MAMMKKLKAERNDRLFADFKEMTANGDTKGVVFKLALKYQLCTQQVYRILWKLDKKGNHYEN